MKISKNMLVSISLKIENENGQLLDESEEILYLHGNYEQIFQKLEDELDGKNVGEHFNVLLQPKEAFGEYDESLVLEESLEDLPEEISLGMELESEDKEIAWIVKEIKDSSAVLNANHELAGISLRVSGEILGAEQLSKEEVKKILKMEHEHEH